MSRAVALILTFAAGAVVGLQPAANAALADHVGDLGAALVSVLISLAVIIVLLLAFGHPSALSGLSAFRPQYALGGIGGAVVVAVALVTVRRLGAGGVIAVLVAAQLIVGVALDRFGAFGVRHVDIDLGRVTGLVLMIAGTALITRG